MNVWAIADLHLSFARPERRERFAARWRDHVEQIESHWRQAVGPEDVILLPGDVSMARTHRELQSDLAWLDRLPGTKVLSPGNHDVWWNGVDKVRQLLRRSLRAVGGDALKIGNAIVCGTRGAPAQAEDFSPQEQAIVDHEMGELDRALGQAKGLQTAANEPVFLLWHYPPFDSYGQPGPWVPRFEQAGIAVCVYGHLHIEGQWSRAIQGNVRGVRYYCVAADALGFRPLRIDGSPSTR
jgi:predicted phosphohydrolase